MSWVDSSSETFLLVCESCGMRTIYLTLADAERAQAAHPCPSQCSTPQCPRKAHSRGLCATHYSRAYEASVKPTALCNVDGCGASVHGRRARRCSVHTYNRQQVAA